MEIILTEEQPGQWSFTVGASYQAFDPDLPGFVPMSKERAEQCANELVARIEAMEAQG